MRYVEAQFLLALARAQHWNALATSGAYKLRRTQRGAGQNMDGSIQFRDCTDDEKLQDVIGTAERHLEFAQACLDCIGETKEQP